MTMIIETSDNRFYRVRECPDINVTHCWLGTPMKRARGGTFVEKVRAREELVRKAASRIVQQPTSWAPEMFVEQKWSRNSLRFATEGEALANAEALFMRWTTPTAFRAAPTTDPVTAVLVDGKLEFKA